MKGIRGYIFSRPFLGERVPQHVQNIVIRDFCQKNQLHYLLSATEYAMEGSFLMLEEVLNDLSNIDGIIPYSLFQLPEFPKSRERIYERILEKGSVMYFAVEGLSFSSENDLERLENIWRVRSVLKDCPIVIDEKYAKS
jgi:sporadic carbohydrate cluster protein (TIGR04323 family)